MDTVTYPEKRVADYLAESYVPLRIKFDTQPYTADFNIKWTPTLITLGADGKEHHRTVGFLGPDDLIASLLLGEAKYHFDNDRFDPALKCLEQVISRYGTSDCAAEALFLTGVCRYKSTHDPKPLKTAYEQLVAKFPNSEWTKRAYPYRLL
ncbi:MAG: tetratricopeptide repeat protein [Thermodesulfobacteriota bacterium]